jgi:hypothetical protein
VLNMSKCMETLWMLKEAAGTRRSYDMRMEVALKTLEMKQLRWMSWTTYLARSRVLPLFSCERSCKFSICVGQTWQMQLRWILSAAGSVLHTSTHV